MRVEHGRADVLVAQQFLNGPDVIAVLEQMGGERVPERVAGSRFHQARPADGLLDGPLQDNLVEVVPSALAGISLYVDTRCGEDPMPSPFPARAWVLPRQSIGQFHPAGAPLEISAVFGSDDLELPGESGSNCERKQGDAVFVALASPHKDLIGGQVHVLDPEPGAFEQPKDNAATVQAEPRSRGSPSSTGQTKPSYRESPRT